MPVLASAAPSKPVPPEKVVREFFAYLEASDHSTVEGTDNHIVSTPDIGSDVAAQERWLSRDLRGSLRRANQYIRLHKPKSGGIPIGEFTSAEFRFAWDPPEKFEIRQTTKATFTAIVAGRFIWGPKQQYAGSVRNGYFILAFEDGAWRVSDIQADPYPFGQSKSSLIRTLNFYQ
jgi:hypothetical protein